MRISTRSRYGMRMILDIALHSKEAPVRIQDVAERQGLSVKYLEKLIRLLKDAHFITSKRGPKGGHMLARELDHITVGEVVSVLEGDDQLVDCTTSDQCCVDQPECLTRRVWKSAAKAMFDKLESITLDQLVDELEFQDATNDVIPNFFPKCPDQENEIAKDMVANYRHP